MPTDGIDSVTTGNGVIVFECALSGARKEVPIYACGENRNGIFVIIAVDGIPCSYSRPIILGINPEGDIDWQYADNNPTIGIEVRS